MIKEKIDKLVEEFLKDSSNEGVLKKVAFPELLKELIEYTPYQAASKPKCVIFSGPPCSSKSSFRKANFPTWTCICRDDIRIKLFGRMYKQNYKDELLVNKEVVRMIKLVVDQKLNVIIDQTNCKRAYITDLIKDFEATHDIEICSFYQPLWKLYVRNICRYLKNGKYIPMKVIKIMFNNQQKIDWTGIIKYVKTPNYGQVSRT